MSTKNIYNDLAEELRHSSPPYSTVGRWAKEFKLGERCPTTSLTVENMKKVEDGFWQIKDQSQGHVTRTSYGRIQTILHAETKQQTMT